MGALRIRDGTESVSVREQTLLIRSGSTSDESLTSHGSIKSSERAGNSLSALCTTSVLSQRADVTDRNAAVRQRLLSIAAR